MAAKTTVVVLFLLSSLCAAKKQGVEEGTVSWYEGPVRDLYGGSCPLHRDAHGPHFPIGIYTCWRNLVILKAGEKYLTLEDHCARPWRFQQGETVEFQRDAKYPRKIYLNRHVFALTRESDSPDQVERTTPAVRESPASSTSQAKISSAGPSGQEPSPRSEVASSPEVSPPEAKEPAGGSLGVTGADWDEQGVRGVQITEVLDNSSAQLAGLHPGDIITQLNGKNIWSAEKLTSILASMEPGARVRIGYLLKTDLAWLPRQTVAILMKAE